MGVATLSLGVQDMNAEARLRELLSRIERCLKCYGKFRDYSDEDRVRIRVWSHEGPWFFPPLEDGGVKGFFGTGNIVFVCERPSMRGGRAPDEWDLQFYSFLKKYGFGNAHITDLVKCRGLARAKEEISDYVENCLPFLKEEIEILKPKLLVAVGKVAYKVLNNRIKPQYPNLKIERITHYSYAFRYNKPAKIESDFEKLKKLWLKDDG
jgi:hypothetical protein